MEVQENLNQVQDGLADSVMNSIGVEESNPDEGQEENDHRDGSHSKESLSVQKRLKSQKRSHDREVRELNSRIIELESRMTQPNYSSNDQHQNSYQSPEGGSVEDHIHKAVSYALQHKEMEERKAHEAKHKANQEAHINHHRQELNKHLDSMNDKYDDFHEVVFGDTPFTQAMSDYALTLPRKGAGSAGEVLYKLGKNRQEFDRIANLPPIEQANEMVALSHALVSGGDHKTTQTSKPLGQIKSNPVTNSHLVTEKTPVSNIRQRMKSGSWK